MSEKPRWEPLPDGDLMTLEEFEAHVQNGMFIDYDGFGEYATATQTSNIEVRPSDVKRGKLDRSYTHVVWFNK